MGGRRTVYLGLTAAALVIAAVAWFATRGARISTEPVAAARVPASEGAVSDQPPPAAVPPAVEAPPQPRQPPEPPAGGDTVGDDAPDQLGGDAIAAAWARVDLAAVRRALPDNLYWQMGEPTTDEQEIERRARERDRWNVEYGKVLSGTGSDEEIRAYFDHRARLSGDYIEFTTYLLDHYGDDLTERDASLLTLARRLHLARLEEVPRHMEEALVRKGEQDEARARWLADERAFQAEDTADDGGAKTH